MNFFVKLYDDLLITIKNIWNKNVYIKKIVNNITNIVNVMDNVITNTINNKYYFILLIIYINFFNKQQRLRILSYMFLMIFLLEIKDFHLDDIYNIFIKTKIYLSDIFIDINIYIYTKKYIIINNLLDILLKIKIEFNNYFSKKNNFILNKVILYVDLTQKYDVTYYFIKNNKIDIINRNTIKDIYFYYNILPLFEDSNIRLKIFYLYNNKKYINYFSYNKILDKDEDINNYYLPFPMYSEEILKNYRDDIISPHYITNVSKKKLYSLFNMESKDILTVKINDIENNDLIDYFNMIKTPFNDYGILYRNPVILNWILSENNINIDLFDTFYLKFLNLYFDEENFELKEHIIEFNKEDLNKIFISKIMLNVLEDKK